MAGDATLCAKCARRFDPLNPPLALLVKLGSIAVHVDEMLSPQGHGYDKIVIQGVLQDPEVIEWIAEMTHKGLLPVKRSTKWLK